MLKSLVYFHVLFHRLKDYIELLKENVILIIFFSNLGHILQSPSANVLPTLPFHVLRSLFSTTPLTTDDGVLLRRMALEIGAIHLILACLSALSHHAPRVPNASPNQAEVSLIAERLQLRSRKSFCNNKENNQCFH